MQITINRDGQQYGPYPVADAAAHLATGALLPTDLAWTDGMTDWSTLGELLAQTQPPAPALPQPVPVELAAPQPQADQYATVQEDPVQPVAAQPMAAQPMAAQPMAAQPMAAQPLAHPAQLGAGAAGAAPVKPLLDPTQLGAGAAVVQPKPKEEPKPKPAKGRSASGLKKFFAGNTKMIVVGVLILGGLGAGVFGVLKYMGGDEVINIEMEPVNEVAVETAEEQLEKFGVMLGFNAVGQINSLTINEKTVTAKELAWVLELKAVEILNLTKCEIDDASLSVLKGLPNLSSLNISDNPKVTDAATGTLSGIKTLTNFMAVGTGITDAGVLKLKEALPDCMVTIKVEGGGNPEGGNPGGGTPGAGKSGTGF